MKKKRFSNKGFTLLELLLVIVLISILAAITIPRFVGRTEKAKIAAAKAEITANISIALDLYELDNGHYPTTSQSLRALLVRPSQPPSADNWQGPYVKSVGGMVDPWGSDYQYISPGKHNRNGYDLYSFGPDGVEGTSDDIVNWITDDELGM